MLILRLVAPIFPACIMLLSAGMVCGQNYPSKPIRIVTSTPGSGVDFAARLIAPGLSTSLGQPVTIDNRAAGVIPGDIVAKSPPDGYTLLVSGSILWLLPFLQNNVPYDPVRDFSPISLTNTAPNILVVHPSMPAKSVKDLIAFAKARPGKINYAAAAVGSPNHLAGELFKSMARVNLLAVPYKGSGPALTAIISGESDLGFVNAASVTPLIKSGRLRALAVTTLQPSELAPGLPPVAAVLPGYESISIYGVLGPAKMPPALITRLNQEIVRVLNRPDIKEKFLSGGVEVVGSSPEQYAAKISSDMAVTGKVIKDAGIRSE